MIKAIIFDFGGVCFYPGNIRQLLIEALFRSNLPKTKILEILLNPTKKRKIKSVVEEFNSGKIDEQKFWKKIKLAIKYEFDEKEIKKILISFNRPIKPVFKILKKLKKNYKIGLLTNNNVWLDEIEKKYNFYKYFDVIVNSYYAGVVKPSKKIYKIILEKLQLQATECVFIDDKKINVDAAKSLGFNVILYKNPNQLLKELKKLNVRI